MPRKPAAKPLLPKPDDPEEYKRFLETAEEVEADKDPKSFDRAFEKIAKAKPQSPE